LDWSLSQLFALIGVCAVALMLTIFGLLFAYPFGKCGWDPIAYSVDVLWAVV
jgi:hypothetical protein